MSTPQPVTRVLLELDDGSDPISGTIITEADGARRAFVGWLDLALAFEEVIGTPAPRAAIATPGRAASDPAPSGF